MKYPIKYIAQDVAKFGPLAGRACNLISFGGEKKLSEKKIVKIANMLKPIGAVVMVGDDPFQWDIWPLVERFIRSGRYVEVHCTGNYPLPSNFSVIPKAVFVSCWPNKRKIHESIERTAFCFIYAVSKKNSAKNGLPKKVYCPANKQKIVVVPDWSRDLVETTEFAKQLCIEHGYYMSYPW